MKKVKWDLFFLFLAFILLSQNKFSQFELKRSYTITLIGNKTSEVKLKRIKTLKRLFSEHVFLVKYTQQRKHA